MEFGGGRGGVGEVAAKWGQVENWGEGVGVGEQKRRGGSRKWREGTSGVEVGENEEGRNGGARFRRIRRRSVTFEGARDAERERSGFGGA